MKELSIEEKAKRYDEAIERAKEINNEHQAQPFDVMLKVFPELVVNKDEKIRKGIMSILKHYKENGECVCPYPFVSIDESIAWLEKQDKKPIIIDIDKIVLKYSQTMDGDFGLPVNCQIRAYRQGINDALNLSLGIKKQGEQKPADKVDEIEELDFFDDFRNSDVEVDSNEDGLIAATINYKNEQKQAWDKEDDNCLSTIIAEFSKCAGKSVSKDEWMRCNDFLNSIRDRVQLKTGWGEEDERIYQSIIDDTVQENQLGSKQINWLKSLKNRVQPKVEWNEEDENMLRRCISATFDHGYLKECDWLKSLRPQSRWKPSKEQIIALRWVLNNIPYNKHKEEISGLLDQIKELKKIEWSEEDENMLRRVFDSLNTYAKNGYSILKSVVEEEINWLKSIKERMKGE